MKRVMLGFGALLVVGIIAAGCGKDEGGKPSAKSQLSNLQPANVSDPAILADAVGSAVAMSQMGADFGSGFGMGMMSALKSMRVPLLRGKQIVPFQAGEPNCSGTENNWKCTAQCEYGGTTTLECSGSETSVSCKITLDNCKDTTDEPAANGTILISGKADSSGNGSFTISIDVTMGKGFVYGSYNLSVTQSGTGATIKETLDISGADDVDPTDVGYIYFDETITMQDLGNYEFKATVNGNGEFGTTKQGKVSIEIKNVVIDPSTCWMEPVSGTITVSAGGSSVTATFDGETNCDGKVTCSGAYTGEIDITDSSEPIIEF